MLCKCYWIVLYIAHVTAFCLGGPFFSGHGVDPSISIATNAMNNDIEVLVGAITTP